MGGLIAWAAGYRLFRFVLTLFGFYIGALAATAVLGPGDRTLLVLCRAGRGSSGRADHVFRILRRRRARRRGHRRAGRSLDLEPYRRRSSRLRRHSRGGCRRGDGDGAAALRHHRRHGICRRVDDRVGRRCSWIDSRAAAPDGGQLCGWCTRSISRTGLWMLGVWMAMALLGVFIQLRFTGRMTALVRAKPAKKP